jgi:hypothetical protein
MANNEAGKTRVNDAHASKLSVSIFAHFIIRENLRLNISEILFDCRICVVFSNYKVQ